MSEKRRLGKGLGALIPEALTGSEETREIELDRIKPNPFQPRRTFEDDKLKELADSIKEHGVLQAVVLSNDDDGEGYILVAGERRCRAARMAGLKTVPAAIKKIDRKGMLEIALIENLQREDLNPVEEARAYLKLMEEFGYTQDELARRLGRSRPAVANSIRLLSLSEPLLEMLARGELTSGQARPLIAISDPDRQHEVAKRIAAEKLSAREAEKMAAQINKRVSGSRELDSQKEVQDPVHAELQQQIQRCLGTKVRIKQSKSGGTIEIFYYSEEDLERLMEKLLPEGI